MPVQWEMLNDGYFRLSHCLVFFYLFISALSIGFGYGLLLFFVTGLSFNLKFKWNGLGKKDLENQEDYIDLNRSTSSELFILTPFTVVL